MCKLGLKVTKFIRKSRKYNSFKGSVGTSVKNRLHLRFYNSVPHQKLTTDTSEFKYYERGQSENIQIEKLYLDPFLGLFSSEILSYRISKHPNAKAIRGQRTN